MNQENAVPRRASRWIEWLLAAFILGMAFVLGWRPKPVPTGHESEADEKVMAVTADFAVEAHWANNQPDFVFEGRSYATRDLLARAVLKARLIRQKEKGIPLHLHASIAADRDLPPRYASQAIGACTAAGITDISFDTANEQRIP